MASGSLTIAVIAGFAAGIILVVSIIISSSATTGSPIKNFSIYEAIQQDLANGIAINKATIRVQKVPEFSVTTGPPICKSVLSQQQTDSSILGNILADADKGERITQRLSSDEFIPIAKSLCVTEPWIEQEKDQREPFYPGWISVKSTDGSTTDKYRYSIQLYWNITEKSQYRRVGPDYAGPLPKYDKVKVYIFEGNSEFYDENLLSEIQTRAVQFEPINLEPFGATPAGIVDRHNFTLVLPNAVDIYIDKELKKPDGSSPVTVKDLPPGTDFAADFSQGSIPVLYDYEYVQVPVVWFMVDATTDAHSIDSHIDEIRMVIDDEISKCLAFKQGHPEREGIPCPD